MPPITFDCEFGERGFYAVMGESGCGKTTLLNILAGLTPFDGGRVLYGGKEYLRCFDGLNGYDYITQDSYFLDFLTVYENLKAVRDDPELISGTLSRFGLEALKDSFPPKLSGGERQRLALARAVLSGSQVIFLDEPTASLDGANRTAVFGLLKGMSETGLVICATHDGQAAEYADNVVRLDKTREGQSVNPAPREERFNSVARTAERGGSAYNYVKKWYASAKYLRRAGKWFAVIMTAVFCVCMLADLPSNKLSSTMDTLYAVNYLKLSTREKVTVADLPENERIKAFNILYSGSVPSGPEPEDGISGASPAHQLVAYFIPDDPAVFRHSGSLECGTFFTGKNQVMLSYEYAENVSPGDHAALVGTVIGENLYGAGNVSLEVAGVFRKMNENEQYYFGGLGARTGHYFINYKVIEPFDGDPDFCFENGQRAYNLFFKNYREAENYLKRNGEFFRERDWDLMFDYSLSVGGGYYELFIVLCAVLLPLSLFAVLLAVIFSTATFKTELVYNGSFLSVLNYLGYPEKQLRKDFVAFRMRRAAITVIISLALSAVLAVSFNLINRSAVIVPFQVFTFNPVVLACAVLIILLSVFVAALSAMRVVYGRTWYSNLTEERDLL